MTVSLESLDNQFVYFGILLVSFIANILIFMPIPIYPILVTSIFDKKLDPNFIAIYSAIGTIIAKTIIFYLVYYGHDVLFKRNRINRKIIPLQKLASKYGWKAAIIAAMTPIPDVIVYVSLGLAKYSPWKFVTSTFVGKLAINEIVVWAAVYLGKPFIDRIAHNNDTIDPFNLAISVIISISIAIVIIYAFMKIDMDKVIRKYFPRAFEDDKTE
jgi:membrane protein DedA with SNARE-associated domain